MVSVARTLRWTVALILVVIGSGCVSQQSPTPPGVLMQVGQHGVTDREFKQAFELAIAACSQSDLEDPEFVRMLKLRLLQQMIDELIIAERAAELGLMVSDQQVEHEIAKLTADFPEGAFQQTLLMQAVSFETWKRQFKTRMLLEAVIRHELVEKVHIGAADITAFYQQNPLPEPAVNNVQPSSRPGAEGELFEHLRHSKAQNMYGDWIRNLRQRYDVQINAKHISALLKP